MIHYTCDLCGRPIDRKKEHLFCVRIEVESSPPEEEAFDPSGSFDDFDLDGLSPLGDPDHLDGASFRTFRHDLCPRCYSAYLADPLYRNRLFGIPRIDN